MFADNMGVLISSPSQYFKVKTSDSGELHELERTEHPKEMSGDVYQIKKNYSCHHYSSDLAICFIIIEGIILGHINNSGI